MLKAYADAGNWVTINGVHVLIGGNGKIVKGPAKFIGSTIADMKNVGKSTADKKAELKKKLAEKKAGSKSKDEASKQTLSDKNKGDNSGGSFKPTKDSLGELQVGDSISFTNSFGEKETFVKTTNPSGRKSDPPTFVYADESGNPKSMSSASNRVSVFGPSELAERASLGQSSATVSKGAVPDISRRVNRKINGFSDETGSSTTSNARKAVAGLKSDEYGTSINTTGKTIVVKHADGKQDVFKPGDKIYNSKALSEYAKDVSFKSSGSTGGSYTSSAYDRVTGSGKYPSGVTTPAQKRAYTRAINSGMSSSDAKKSALGKATNTSKSDMSTFKKGATSTSKTTGKYTADNIPKIAGASKSVMRKTADLMNKGYSFDDAFDEALLRNGYGMGTRRGMFR